MQAVKVCLDDNMRRTANMTVVLWAVLRWLSWRQWLQVAIVAVDIRLRLLFVVFGSECRFKQNLGFVFGRPVCIGEVVTGIFVVFD